MNESPFSELRILVAEDLPAMRRILLSMLRHLGYKNLAVADDGLEAWGILSTETIGLVISDWNMPKMTGIELLHKMRSTYEYENIPFIMVTGELDEASVARAADVEVDSYILKPFIPKELDEKIAYVLENRNNPSDYQKLLSIGRQMARKKMVKEAIPYLKAAISLSPHKPIGHCFLGQLHEDSGNFKEAKAAYIEALAINPRYIRALDGLLRIYSQENNRKNLYEVLSVLINISPKNVERQLMLGKLAFEAGDKERARHSLSKAIELDPNNIPQLQEVGQLYLDHGMLDEAEKIFDALLAKSPKNPNYLTCSAEICQKRGKREKARTLYLAALQIEEDESIHFSLAMLFIEIGSRRLAEYHLEAALNIEPKFDEARLVLKELEERIAKAKTNKEQ